jgi:hypothetical protein
VDAVTDNELLSEARERFKWASDNSTDQYQKSVDDLRFIRGDGNQWPKDLRASREIDQRPCLEINKLPTFADQIIGDLRQNEPQVKIKPIDSKADPETAEIFTGLIRNIEVQSSAEIAYDTATESAIICGIGAWRINTHYTDDDVFEQDIVISRIKNPFTVYWDPSSTGFNKEDALYCFVTEKLSKDEFKRQFPKASMAEFSATRDANWLWGDGETIRIAEYWKKEPIKKKIYLVQPVSRATGQPGEMMITEEKPDEQFLSQDPQFIWKVVKDRSVDSHKLLWYKVNGNEILEEPVEWSGKFIPIVMVYGKELNIENETEYRGIVRHAKDPQRLYNYMRSTGAELTSLAPKAPYLVTSRMIGAYQAIWDASPKRNYAYLPFDVDPAAPGLIPQRAAPVGVNTGIMAEIQVSDQEMRDTTGLQQASLGMKSNEKSGKAILARQREGDVGSFPFHDNLARALTHQGKILMDLIPKIYDTPRIIRILNRDNSDKFVQVNKPFEEDGMKKVYDLTVGKYDCVVTVGPSYTTQRDETATNMLEFVKVVPQAGPLVGDLLAKNLDFPGSDEIQKRLKLLLPPTLQQGGEGGKPLPPPPPNPLEMLAQKKLEEEAMGLKLDNEIKYEQLQRLKKGLPMEPPDPIRNAIDIKKANDAANAQKNKSADNAGK